MYVSPDDSCQENPEKKQPKLEKFYSKKNPSKELRNNEDLMGVSGMNYDDYGDKTGIYQNPLFGIKNQSYDPTKEETSV